MKNTPKHNQWVSENGEKVLKYKSSYREKNREKLNAASKEYRRIRSSDPAWKKKQCDITKAYYARAKQTCFSHYGNQCVCCGESRVEFLCMDHVNGGGTKARRAGGKAGVALYARLVARGFPDGYRLLCHNCNQALGYHGFCPHQREAFVTNVPTLSDFDLATVIGL